MDVPGMQLPESEQRALVLLFALLRILKADSPILIF